MIPTNELRRHPQNFVTWLDQHKVNELFGPNVLIEAVCEAACEQRSELTALTDIAQAGEALNLRGRLRDFYNGAGTRKLHNLYGPTETQAVTAYNLPHEISAWPLLAPIGRPIRSSNRMSRSAGPA